MVTVKKNNITINVVEHPTPGGLNWWINTYPDWEKETFEVFDKYLTKDMNYLDLGVFTGQTAIYAAHKVKHVYGVDLDIVALNACKANIAVNPVSNITIQHVAIADRNSYACLTGTPGGSSRRVMNFVDSPIGFQFQGEYVPTKTLFTLQKEWQIEKFDFIKIDIEGGEEFVLPSIQDYLKKHKPIVWLSVHRHYGATAKTIASVAKDCYNSIYDVNGKNVYENLEECIDNGPSGFGNDYLLISE